MSRGQNDGHEQDYADAVDARLPALHFSDGLPSTAVNVPMPPVKPPRAPDTIIIPTTPPRALLVSMALRLRHDFGMNAVFDDGVRDALAGGLTPREREAMLTEMAQLYEEVAGKGFYRWSDGPEQRGGLYRSPQVAQYQGIAREAAG